MIKNQNTSFEGYFEDYRSEILKSKNLYKISFDSPNLKGSIPKQSAKITLSGDNGKPKTDQNTTQDDSFLNYTLTSEQSRVLNENQSEMTINETKDPSGYSSGFIKEVSDNINVAKNAVNDAKIRKAKVSGRLRRRLTSQMCDAIQKEYNKVTQLLRSLEEKSNKVIRKKLQNLKQIFRRNEEKDFAKAEAEIFGLIQQVKCSVVYLSDVKSQIEQGKFSYHLKGAGKQSELIENEFSEKYESKLMYLIENMTKTLSLRLSGIITHYQKFKIHVSDYNKKEKSKQNAILGKESVSGRQE